MIAEIVKMGSNGTKGEKFKVFRKGTADEGVGGGIDRDSI